MQKRMEREGWTVDAITVGEELEILHGRKSAKVEATLWRWLT
jgi:hypothetical protein